MLRQVKCAVNVYKVLISYFVWKDGSVTYKPTEQKAEETRGTRQTIKET
jgi:hypothetical protein